MKNFALVIAFMLLTVVPASAGEAPKVCPVMTPATQTQEAIPLIVGFPQPIPRCYELSGDPCPTAGATRSCTDACNNDLSCTCRNFFGGTYGTTFLGRYWVCQHEC